MAHIPPDKIQPQDMVEIWDLGPPEPESPKPAEGLSEAKKDALAAEHQTKKDEWDDWKKNPGPRSMRMHVSDARQAMDKEPERYVLDHPDKDKKADDKKPAADAAKHEPPATPAKPADPHAPERKK